MKQFQYPHFTSQDFFLYLRKDLTAQESARIEAHLAECERCVHRARRAYFAIGGSEPASTVSDEVARVPEPALWFPKLWFPRFAIAGACAAGLLLGAVWFRAPIQRVIAAWIKRPVMVNPATEPILRDATVAAAYSKSRDVILTGRTIPDEWRNRARQLIESKSVVQPPEVQIAMDRMRSGVLERGADRTPGRDPVLLSPIATAIGSVRPSFRWIPVANAQTYTLSIEDETKKKLPSHKAGDATEFTLPPDAALPQGHTYTWQVTATVAGDARISTLESFRIPDADTLSTVARLEKELAGSAILLAALYETYGYYDDAEEQLRRLAALNPKASLPVEMQADLAKRREKK
jgi:hypothetical protein